MLCLATLSPNGQAAEWTPLDPRHNSWPPRFAAAFNPSCSQKYLNQKREGRGDEVSWGVFRAKTVSTLRLDTFARVWRDAAQVGAGLWAGGTTPASTAVSAASAASAAAPAFAAAPASASAAAEVATPAEAAAEPAEAATVAATAAAAPSHSFLLPVRLISTKARWVHTSDHVNLLRDPEHVGTTSPKINPNIQKHKPNLQKRKRLSGA